jgi:hypothetical protein
VERIDFGKNMIIMTLAHSHLPLEQNNDEMESIWI